MNAIPTESLKIQILSASALSEQTKKNILNWLHESYTRVYENDLNAHQLINQLVEEKNWEELNNRFFSVITPGTAGMRGTLGVGSTRINEATVGCFVQAHANYLKKYPVEGRKGIILGGDSRKGSYDPLVKGPGYLQKMAAQIYAAAGIPVYISDKPFPTPLISFSIGEVEMDGALPVSGAVNTASHNPSQDNGFKIYETGGHQVVSADFNAKLKIEIKAVSNFGMVKMATLKKDWPQTAKELNEAITTRGRFTIETDGAMIHIVSSKKIIEQYASKIAATRLLIQKNFSSSVPESQELSFIPEILESLKKQKIVITSLNGCGWESIKILMEKLGMQEGVHFFSVKDENIPDGSFPTGIGKCKGKPNPEYPENFHKAAEIAFHIKAKYIFAADPDADRLGIGMIDPHSTDAKTAYKNTRFFSGNEQLAIPIWYLGLMNTYSSEDVFVQTLVSSTLYSKMVSFIGATIHFVPVGFKYFGQISNHYVSELIQSIRKNKPEFNRLAYSRLNQSERLSLYEEHHIPHFIHGGEESMGQNLYDYVFDKDTPAAISLFCEMIGFLGLSPEEKTKISGRFQKKSGGSLNIHKELLSLGLPVQDLGALLMEIHRHFGVYKEEVFSLRFEGEQGEKIKNKVMSYFRTVPIKELNLAHSLLAHKILYRVDYKQKGDGKYVEDENGNHHSTPPAHPFIEIPPLCYSWIPEKEMHCLDSSDYIVFYLDDGNTIHLRPSGTEPIVKIYLNFHDHSSEPLETVYPNISNKIQETFHRIKDRIQILSETV